MAGTVHAAPAAGTAAGAGALSVFPVPDAGNDNCPKHSGNKNAGDDGWKVHGNAPFIMIEKSGN